LCKCTVFHTVVIEILEIFTSMNSYSDNLSTQLLQSGEELEDIDDDEAENVRHWGDTPHNDSDESDDSYESHNSEDDEREEDANSLSSESTDDVSSLFSEILGANNALNDEDSGDDATTAVHNNNVPCTFSLPGENYNFLKTLIFYIAPVSCISLFAMFYVYDATRLFQLGQYWVWFPLLVFALITCAYSTFKSCQLVVRRDGDDEETTSDRRDKASFFCTFTLCHILPLFFTIQVGMHVTNAQPLMYFVPLMIFPCLVLIVATLLLCCSDIDPSDRCYTALIWVIITCWFGSFLGISLKMQGIINYPWSITLIPSYVIDIVLLLVFYLNWKKGLQTSNGSYVAKTLVASSLYLMLTISKFVGTYLANKDIANKLIWVYAPVYACAPLLIISVPIIFLCQICSKMIYDRQVRYKVQNRVNWEDSKRIMHDAMCKVKFDNDASDRYNPLPDEEEMEKGVISFQKNNSMEVEIRHNATNGGRNTTSKTFAPYSSTSNVYRSNNRFSSKASITYDNNNIVNYGSTGSSKEESGMSKKTKIINAFEHGKMLFEEAQTEEEIINSIKYLKQLCEQHDQLRTRLYKQQLILAGQLKRSQEKFWSKNIALNFGSLLKVWQGKFNLKRSNSIDVEHVIIDNTTVVTNTIGNRQILQQNLNENNGRVPFKRGDRLKNKALNVLKRGFKI
jgi:hypothetical protein